MVYVFNMEIVLLELKCIFNERCMLHFMEDLSDVCQHLFEMSFKVVTGHISWFICNFVHITHFTIIISAIIVLAANLTLLFSGMQQTVMNNYGSVSLSAVQWRSCLLFMCIVNSLCVILITAHLLPRYC